jgi:hypothetical protein
VKMSLRRKKDDLGQRGQWGLVTLVKLRRHNIRRKGARGKSSTLRSINFKHLKKEVSLPAWITILLSKQQI